MLFGCYAFAQNKKPILDGYMAVKEALVQGDSKAASRAIHEWYRSVQQEGDFAYKKELLKASEALDKADNLEQQRAAFGSVSTGMWKWLKSTNDVGQELYYQYCPMKKAYWLSQGKEIRNPYYGSSMLTCGKTIETYGGIK